MAEKEGWIKIYRKMQDCWVWQLEGPFDKRSAWIDLLLTANHKDVKLQFNNELIVVERGQILTSTRKLSARWGWGKDKVLRFLRLLESDGMVLCECDRDKTLLTIEKYEVYQESSNTNETDARHQRDTDETWSRQNKNEKNEKNNNIYINNKNLSCSNDTENDVEGDKKAEEKNEVENNFKLIYESYPKKVGKAKGFDIYKGWLKGRDVSGRKIKLTNRQMWDAISKYKSQIEKNGTELQYVKNFDTFMNKAILDYLEEEE